MKNNDTGGVSPSSDPRLETSVVRAEAAFKSYVSAGGGDFGLSLEKIGNRGYLVKESNSDPRKCIISIERHRAIAGCSYRRGLPMAAFETYLQTFVFDCDTELIQEGEEVHLEYTIDMAALAEEHMFDWRHHVVIVDPRTGMRRVNESCTSWSFETDSLQDARDRIDDHIRSLYYDYIFENIGMSDDERDEYTRRLEDACAELALRRVEIEWREAKEE